MTPFWIGFITGFLTFCISFVLVVLFMMGANRENKTCERCKKLEFMVENGLGYEDMQSDL